jgi:hypothetical protein
MDHELLKGGLVKIGKLIPDKDCGVPMKMRRAPHKPGTPKFNMDKLNRRKRLKAKLDEEAFEHGLYLINHGGEENKFKMTTTMPKGWTINDQKGP